ncbi:7440_t:CDS:2 [Entrophospora sp. SA101]|nr:7440_t:CDS:2 [Entrophospora sp. SA101]
MAKNIMKLECPKVAFAWNCLHERDNELNKHLDEDQKVVVNDVGVNIDDKANMIHIDLSGNYYKTPEPIEQISLGSLNSSGSNDDDEAIVNKLNKYDYLTGLRK